MVQLVLEFWWDSVQRTRTLEEPKRQDHLTLFRELSSRRVATLHELQSLVGRMHRAIMTMPPGLTLFPARVLPLL